MEREWTILIFHWKFLDCIEIQIFFTWKLPKSWFLSFPMAKNVKIQSKNAILLALLNHRVQLNPPKLTKFHFSLSQNANNSLKQSLLQIFFHQSNFSTLNYNNFARKKFFKYSQLGKKTSNSGLNRWKGDSWCDYAM